jgi:putative ABC transport system permease protein
MNLQIVARLRDGWTARRARADLTAIQSELVARYPDADGRMDGVTVKPLREALNFAWDVLSISFRILLGAVAVVLLIACLNVASLTLARGSGRRREVAVRAAMGAPRGRIVRQLLAESLVLALAGGALGVVLSYWVTGLIDPVLPEDLYRVGHIDIDGTVLLFSLAVTLVTPLVFGLWPALTASRTSLGEGLKESSRGSSGPASSRGRSALVIAQVANAVVLITGAGLMVRSLAAVREIDVGFEPDPILTAEVALPASDYPTAEERVAYLDRAVAALAARPGVASASAVAWIPLNHELMTLQVAPLEQAGTSRDEWPLSTSDEAWIGYFETMGVPLLEGRTFTAADGVDAEAVAIVSRTLARRLWPRESAVGRTFVAADEGGEPVHLRVVGIVGDVRHEDLSWSASGLQMYRPIAQAAGRRYFLLARGEGPPATLVAEARAALLGVDPNLPANVRPMTSVLREDLLQWSIGSVFMGAFGTGALLLATLGIYGLIAYSVAQRRREIGVRMALGATRGDVRRVVVRDGLRLTVFGLGIGLVLAVVLAHLAASTLYGVGPFDPVTLGAVAGLFLAVAGLASLIPAERASRTDPIHVMRAE